MEAQKEKALGLAKELMTFIQEAPSMFHTIEGIKKELAAADFQPLKEGQAWSLTRGGRYYVTRNDSSLIAFTVGEDLEEAHFQLTASHSDSPTFKLKSEALLQGPGPYTRLNVEGYGGMIDASWLDRPLSLAGRVMVDTPEGLTARLVDLDEDLLIIPNAPIHFNRSVNSGYEFNHQRDLIPLYSTTKLDRAAFEERIAEAAGVRADQILSRDLFLVNRQAPALIGPDQALVGSPKLDDLQCAFAALRGFLAGHNPSWINVYACFDNEEVGSNTKQGALSTFLKDSLTRILAALGYPAESYYQAVARSFLVSCDNAHAFHPNRPDFYDEGNRVFLNEGVVIKENASQSYTSDAFSQAVFKKICAKAAVPCQHFANRSDVRGGSTLGNLSNTQVSLHAVDIGLAQLAMHSAYETCGSLDTLYAVQALECFYSTNIQIDGASGARFLD